MSDDKEKVVNALGGTRGLIDSGLPALVFMVSFYITKEIRPSVTYALILSVGLTLARLIKKDTIQHALSGLFGVAICAFFATKTGKAENFYLPGLIINVVYGTLYLFLNLSTPAPCLIKSYGLNENAPMSDKSTSTCNVWLPNGTPQIIKSPASLVLTV